MRPYRKISGQDNAGTTPGLTPIDNIHGNTRAVNLDPDGTTGRLPSQEEADEGNAAPKPGRRAKQAKRKS